MFEPLPAKFDFATTEREVLAFWDRHDVFGESLRLRRNSPRFVFYEGPPTANGLPHPGHALTRAMKDLFPRYRTMTGHLVERKAGWDTHGLPVEVEVCKELGIHTKQEIEAYGVEKFNLKCIQSVFRYTREWEEMTRRLGFWVNLAEAYVTYHQSYVESVWWGLKTLFERGLLYQGHKVVWWWAQGGTALSSGEVGEGYRTVDDPSVFVKFPLVEWFGSEGKAGRESLWKAIQRVESIQELSSLEDAEAPLALGSLLDLLSSSSLAPLVYDEAQFFEHLRGRGEEYVRKLSAPRSLLIWTTTPWTLVSNHFAAVHPELEYSVVYDAVADESYIVATELIEALAKKTKREWEQLYTCRGTALIKLQYLPPFPEVYYERPFDRMPGISRKPGVWYEENVNIGDLKGFVVEGGADPIGWRVVAADFVTIESGTGLVHEAPAYGEVDFNLLQEERKRFEDPDAIPLLNAVNPDGTFNDDAPPQYRGRWVKDCDKEIIRELRDVRKTPWETPLLYHQEVYRHEYPFCPRSENDPLIQYARKSWFVRTSQFKEEFLRNNAAVKWLPEHIQDGRFGDFLRNNVDWALSRERYWGTPLPVWQCETCGRMEAIGSLVELRGKPDAHDRTEDGKSYWDVHNAAHGGDLPEHLRVHKPYIDAWTYECEKCGQKPGGDAGVSVPRMRRVPEVIDCWWDAGSMPFAQWGFPHAEGSVQALADRFPADFISEAIDQTRGWFYGLLAINTLLSGAMREQGGRDDRPTQYPIPFKTCIVLGHMMGEDGNKMSKRLRNYKEPSYIFDRYGADAMRWYFYSAQAPWTSTRFAEANIRDAHRDFLVKLYNVLNFFIIYANIDGFEVSADGGMHHGNGDGRTGWRPAAQRNELDRWVLSELHRTIRFGREKMDAFENFPAAQRLNEFVDALSNWYVRRSRDRFWQHEKNQDKWDAYNTLYETLTILSRLIAPFTPFFAETMYQTLQGARGGVQSPGTDRGGRSGAPVSVHLCDYPAFDESLIDEGLAAEMEMVREIVSTGRAARTAAKIKVRQPLSLVEIVLGRREHEEWLRLHAALIAEELNVKQVEFTAEADHYVTYKVVPNFKAIGAKYRELVPRIKEALARITDVAAARRVLITDGFMPISVGGQTLRLTAEEVEIRLEARPGWSAAQSRGGVVVMKTDLDRALIDEGVCRELIHQVQAIRKDLELAYQARVILYICGPDEIRRVVDRFEGMLKSECLADRIEFVDTPPPGSRAADLEGGPVHLAVATTAS